MRTDAFQFSVPACRPGDGASGRWTDATPSAPSNEGRTAAVRGRKPFSSIRTNRQRIRTRSVTPNMGARGLTEACGNRMFLSGDFTALKSKGPYTPPKACTSVMISGGCYCGGEFFSPRPQTPWPRTRITAPRAASGAGGYPGC